MHLEIAFGALVSLAMASDDRPYYDVPPACEQDLRAIRRGAGISDQPVNWRPWAQHLRGLGYPANYVAPLMVREKKEDSLQLHLRIRNALQDPNWEWSSGLDARQSGEIGAAYAGKAELPLEYLSQIPGFNGEAAMERFLTVQRDGALGEDSTARLARYAPFWLNGPNADRLAKLALEKINCYDVIAANRWLRSHVPTSARSDLTAFALERVREMNYCAKLVEDILFQALDHVRSTEFETFEWRALRRKLTLGRRTSSITAPSVRTISRGVEQSGDCYNMAFNHLGYLWPNAFTRYLKRGKRRVPVVLRVNGRVIGLLKTEGDPSVLALQNVIDGKGSRTLIKGGVYDVHADLRQRPSRPCGSKDWRCVDVTELEVVPRTPVLNEEAWQVPNLPMIARILGGPVDRNSRVLLELAARSIDDDHYGRLRTRYHREVWARIIERIDFIRADLERTAN